MLKSYPQSVNPKKVRKKQQQIESLFSEGKKYCKLLESCQKERINPVKLKGQEQPALEVG